MSALHQERVFQNEITAHLEANGWLHSPNSDGYDRERALYPEDLLGWLQDHDPDNYAKIVRPDASEAEQARGKKRILDRVVKRLETPENQDGGVLNTLRKGFALPGARRFQLLQMPPADDRNPNNSLRYQQNRLRVVQEVTYSNKRDRIDLVLFLNGIPVATIELKSDYTQTVQHAINQYKHDRNPKGEPLLTYGRGAIVHFAVSQTEIHMTTRLEGPKTTFLPFNKGHNGGAGNPPQENKAPTSYLWEEILHRDTWMTILTKFVYTNKEQRLDAATGRQYTKTQIRFPRYHQLRAVTRLIQTAREEGPGHNYLIQHSAGSGKTDSIAWTAHRLASLHNPDGHKTFDAVFVLADRQVLDKQLQDAVDQLVTQTGTFQAITTGTEGSKTTQLLDAITAGVAIIGVTLQTFPHALKALNEPDNEAVITGKHFAVIADEAHSSQSGAASEAVKELLYSHEDPNTDEDEPGADQDALIKMAAQADSDNRLSYFAFTATPKAKTLETFGRRPTPDAPPQPFDVYSMKQAIQEGFILDVLQNYTTYDMAARIAQKSEQNGDATDQDEDVDIRKGTRALIGFVELHPTNIASKVKVILDHYTNNIQNLLGGNAKAMVVTSSRAAAIRYHRAFEKAIREANLPVKTLVAFSGELPDPDITPLPGTDHPTITETQANPETHGNDLADVFNQPDQNILVVANKYQTGFDQPALVAMYVDKKLSGLAAVQTLSRLNRTAPGKDKTYILDFVNEPEQILQAFETYYEDATLHTESDPDLVADLADKLDAQNIYTHAEINRVWQEWTAPPSSHANTNNARQGRLTAALNAPVERFANRWQQAIYDQNDDELAVLQDFRTTLKQYRTAYEFLSQIINYGDPHYQKFSTFADLLSRRLANFRTDETETEHVDISDIVLTHYRLEKVREENLQLSAAEVGLRGMTEAGMAQMREQQRVEKPELIELVNKYFGDLGETAEYLVADLELLRGEIEKNEDLQLQARNNTRTDFEYSPRFRTTVEDALWTHELHNQQARNELRRLPWEKLRDLLLEFGIYETLRKDAG